MKKRKNNKLLDLLSLKELTLTKGGDERDYYTVIIDGKEVRIYV